MKSIRNVLTGTLLAGGALLTAATSYSIATAADAPTTPAATAPSDGHHWHHHRGFWHVYGKLGLTDAQKESIKAIFTAAKPQMTTLRQQAQANRLKLLQTNPGQSNYSAVVAEVAQSNAALSTQRATQMAELHAQIYNSVLTAPQKAQLATLQAQMAAKITARDSAH
jgi:Spy/CpxP family protein refolding chaperone